MGSEGLKTIGDYVTLQRGNTYKSNLLNLPGPYLLGLGSIERNGGFRAEKLKTYGGPSQEKLLVRPGDLFVSLKDITQAGDLLGSIARVPPSVPVGRMTQDTVKLVFKEDAAIDNSFFYWCLRTPIYKDYCRARALGTTNLSLSRDDFLAFPIPEYTEERQTIVSALDAIEAKIELNRHMNTTLEAMAQALFKSWFVDFDPVIDNALAAGNPIPDELADHAERRAKAAQQQSPDHPHTLPAAIRQQFPDRFVFSETMGWVPEGWEVSTVGDQVDTTGGGTPSTKDDSYWDGGHHPFCTPKDMSRLSSWVLLDTERHLTESGVNKVSSGLLPSGAVLMSSRAPIGYLAINDRPVAVNQGVIAMLPNAVFGSLFLLNWAKMNMDKINDRANGSTFLEISKKNFRTIPFLVPVNEVARLFNQETTAIYSKILLLAEEIESLTNLRDTLLPKLLSGQLRVPGAQAALDEALAVI